MSIFDLFRNVFGFLERPSKFIPDVGTTDQLLNPAWGNDDESNGDIGHGHPNFGFSSFSGPLEQLFEQQMIEMMKQFQILQDTSIFGLTELPAENDPLSRSPRDEVLKPGFETIDGPAERLDKDLDEHIAKYGLSSLINPQLDVAVPTQIRGQIITRKVIRRSDGSVEHEEVVRGNGGNEQRTVTHTIGNQSHSVVTTTGPNGVQTSEILENIDQDKLDEFEKRWDSSKNQKPVGRPKLGLIPDDFPFDKFFK